MAKVIMGIGIPGSGKTTFLKTFAERYSYTYISIDDIRKEFTGDAINQTQNKEVWQEAYRRVVEYLAKGETVVFDASFAKDFERKAFIKFVRENGAEKVQGIFADVPFEIASERNKARERVVPEYAIKRMHGMLKDNPPVVEDGFDGVFDINEFQELEYAEKEGKNEILSREFRTKFK